MTALPLALADAYLLGSIPTAYLMVWWLKRMDVREVGSGNVGATNATRVAGFKIGVVVFLMDALKGWVAVQVLAPRLLLPLAPMVPLACGLTAVLGHLFPIWLRFRGGKGVATTIGVLIGAQPQAALVVLGVWLLVFLPWRTVSLASLAAAIAIPITQLVTRRSPGEVAVGGTLALLIIVRHGANIARLAQGTEPRVGVRR